MLSSQLLIKDALGGDTVVVCGGGGSWASYIGAAQGQSPRPVLCGHLQASHHDCSSHGTNTEAVLTMSLHHPHQLQQSLHHTYLALLLLQCHSASHCSPEGQSHSVEGVEQLSGLKVSRVTQAGGSRLRKGRRGVGRGMKGCARGDRDVINWLVEPRIKWDLQQVLKAPESVCSSVFTCLGQLEDTYIVCMFGTN